MLLAHKTADYIRESEEASLYLFSTKDRPLTIADPPCSRTDISTVIPEETCIIGKRTPFNIDTFQYFITSQMKMPVIENQEALQLSIADKLEKPGASWDLDATVLQKHGFLDANYNTRPLSVLRESLAFARAQNIKVVGSEEASKIFDDYFKWNFEYL